MDPRDFWKRWLEAGASMWTPGPGLDPDRLIDPFGLLREPERSSAHDQDYGRARTRPPALPDFMELWHRWIDLMVGTWGKPAVGGADPAALTKHWLELWEQAGAAMTGGTASPPAASDPLALFQRWYEANSEAWARAAEGMIGSEAFMQATSRFLDAYVSGYRAVRQASEHYLRNAQLPARADVARVAGLVVALEEKVDRIEEALEALPASASDQTTAAMTGSVERLAERISRIEGKLDRLLAAAERSEVGAHPERAPAANGMPRTERAAGRASTSRSTRSTTNSGTSPPNGHRNGTGRGRRARANEEHTPD
jgi:polyhydroxyalkanoic acid synthase PhaR subunit